MHRFLALLLLALIVGFGLWWFLVGGPSDGQGQDQAVVTPTGSEQTATTAHDGLPAMVDGRPGSERVRTRSGQASRTDEDAVPRTRQVRGQRQQITAGRSDAGSPENRSGQIWGRVLDSAGYPVSGAFVEAMPQRVESDLVKDFEALSGPEGQFTFNGLPSGEYRLQAQAPYGSVSSRPITVRTDSEAVDLVMPDSTSLHVTGAVMDTLGNPVEGVEVRATGLTSSPALTDSRGHFELTVEHRTDSAMVFHFAHDEFRVHRESLRGDMAEGRVELIVTLARLESLVTVGGVVMNESGEAVSGRQVSLQHDQQRYRARTGDDGIFVFPEVEGGRDYRLIVASSDDYYGYQRQSFRVPDHDLLDVVIELSSRGRGSIEGIVIDRLGRPIPDFPMRVSVDQFNEMIETDRGGRFSLSPVPEGQVRLSTASQPRFVTSGAALRPNQELQLRSIVDVGEHSLTGVVVDDLGMPVANARVTLSWVLRQEGLTHESLRHSVSDQHGRFSFHGFGPGARVLIVNADDFEAARVTVEPDANPVIELVSSP